MKLDAARLCLDCEEVHEEQICPSCSSEAFAFLTRWIEPSSEPRSQPRRPRPRSEERTPPNAEQVEAYRQLLSGEPPPPRRGGLVTKSILGLAAMGVASWAYRAARAQLASRKEDAARLEDAVRKEEGTREKGESSPAT
jgi:hypothetical protein